MAIFLLYQFHWCNISKSSFFFYMPSHVNMGRPSSNSVLLQSLISQLFLKGLDLIASSRFFRQYHVFPMQENFIAGFPWWILGSPRTSMYLLNVKIHDMLSANLQIFILEHKMLLVLAVFTFSNLQIWIFLVLVIKKNMQRATQISWPLAVPLHDKAIFIHNYLLNFHSQCVQTT